MIVMSNKITEEINQTMFCIIDKDQPSSQFHGCDIFSSVKNAHLCEICDFWWISMHLVSPVKIFGLLSIHFYKDFFIRGVPHFTA